MALAPLIVASSIAASTHPTRRFYLFRLGFVAGLVGFAGTLYWVVGVMQLYGGLATPVAILVALLLWAYLSIYTGVFALLVGAAVRRWGVSGVWLAPAFWVATEWLRASVGLHFPWVLIGASQATVVPIAQLASVFGVFGLSALLALAGTAAAAVALSQRPAHRRGAIAVGVLIVIVAVSGVMRVTYGRLARSGTPVRVGLIQGNVDQNEKYDQAFRDAILGRYIALSRRAIAAGAEVVIWPEASTPFYFDAEMVLSEPIRRLAVQSRVPFIIGTDHFERSRDGAPPRYYNSAVLLGTDGRSLASYRKMQLVPFGEYVPMKNLLFFVGPLIEAVSDFSAGDDPVVFDVEGRRISVAICYESVYPWISREFVQRGSQLLATITNDAWFGTSSAARQHFDQGALRAIEEGRFVVRSANTGISGAVDPYGRTMAATPLFTAEAITVDVRLLDHRTIYSWIGDVVAWLALAVTALVVATGRRRRAA